MNALLSLTIFLSFSFATEPRSLEDSSAWRPIFDGTSLDGWRHVGEGEFLIEDGILRTVGGMGLLWYEPETFGDCQIQVVFRAERPIDNSGVFIRIDGPPADPWHAVHRGYEVQIDGAGDQWHRTGSIYSLARASVGPKSNDGWDEMIITLDGDLVEVVINGEKVNTFDPSEDVPERMYWYEPKRGPRPTRGYIGLQNHAPEETVLFRAIRVRSLPTK